MSKKTIRDWLHYQPVQLGLAICLVTVLVLGAVAGTRQQIKINVDGKVVRHSTLQRTLGAAIAEAGIKLGPKDLVSPDPGTTVKNGMTAIVGRAVKVRLTADGRTREVLAAPTTVAEVLKEAGISLGAFDRTNLPLKESVRNNTDIRVARVAVEMVTEQYSLPAPVEKRPDSSLESGRTRLVRDGSPGEGERVVRVSYEDGDVTARETVTERIVRPAVSRIIAVGTLRTVNRGGSNLRYREVIDARATAYNSMTGVYTATGHKAAYGVVAVDPRVIPLGTRLYVENYGYATALDVGGAIKGNRIDVFLPTEAECRKWGVRTVKVYILE